MKMRNKGKVHPTPSSSAPSLDIFAILKLLPTAILTLASVLSLPDKEVLAYMLTRSLKTTINNPSNILEDKSKKNTNRNIILHRPPMFDCECFACYTSYWSKWNSSPNRELIHQAIEAFEEHLNTNNGELSSKNKGRNKKRDKLGRRGTEKIQENGTSPENQESSPGNQESSPGNQESSPEIHGSPEIVECGKGLSLMGEKEVEEMVVEVAPPVCTAVVAAGCGSSHKGLARKVLPDVLGLLNSRLWSLWSPNF